MTSSIKAALALTLFLAAPAAASASTQDHIRPARLGAEIRRGIRQSMAGGRRARMATRQAVRRAMARDRRVVRDSYRRTLRETRRAARDARRHFWRD